MKEITEDYCDFETAKLLKKKGFDERCFCFYENDGKLYHDMEEYFPEGMNNSEHEREFGLGIAAPSLQMAMKWLREFHNINIEVFYFGDGDPARWAFEIIRLPIGVTVFGEYNEISYEESCEAAIKYCLENLV